MVTFSGVFELSSSIETDKIGIVINMTCFQIRFTGNEKSRDQCRWIVSLLALSTNDGTVLGGVDDTIETASKFQIASWLRWTRDMEQSLPPHSAPRLPEQPQITAIDIKKITLDLLVFRDPRL